MFHKPIEFIPAPRSIASLLAVLFMLLLAVPEARADVPAYVPFQGFLTDELGQPIDGLTDITFSIYDRETGGTPLFTETRTIMVEQGFLNLFIGSVNTLDPAVLDNPATYLGIKINTDGEMIDRTRLASVPYAFFADQCKNADTLEGMSAAAFAPAAPSWSSITNRPAGLDNGDDNTTYAAGSGLTLTGATFSVDAAYAQRRVTDSCAPGSAIRAIAADGAVSCESDTDTDTNTTYTAASGLELTGTAFGIDPAYTQRRVSGTCNAGSSIRTIAADGTVACESDTDTTYTAASGLDLTGTAFSINPAYTQRRVSGACAAGSSVRAIYVDGAVDCESDTDTLYTAAAVGGLALDGTNRFSIASQGIVASMIADHAITSAQIAAGTITGAELGTNTITASNIAGNAVDSSEISTGAVGASEIATAAVNLDELADLPAGSELVVQASISKTTNYDLTAAEFTPSAAARCLVTVSAFAEHDGSAALPITFRVLSSSNGTTLVGSPLTSSLPVAGQVLTTAASTSATWNITATATAFGCRISVPNDIAYSGGAASCNVSWVCF